MINQELYVPSFFVGKIIAKGKAMLSFIIVGFQK